MCHKEPNGDILRSKAPSRWTSLIPRLSSPSRDLPRQTFQASIQEVKNVPRVVSVTSFRDPTQSSSIIDRWLLHIKQPLLNLFVISSSGQQTSFFQGTSPSFTVGSSEEELKETFLTTGIFQRKPGDSLDGRRSFKRFRRQSERRNSYGGSGSYNQPEPQQDCQSVASEQCRDTPRQKCSTEPRNCQMTPRKVCREVPR